MTGSREIDDRAGQLGHYRHLLAMTRDPALADDLTQETFLRAVSHTDQLHNHDAARAYPPLAQARIRASSL